MKHKIIKVEGAGDCFFYVISHFITNDKKKPVSVATIRADIASYLSKELFGVDLAALTSTVLNMLKEDGLRKYVLVKSTISQQLQMAHKYGITGDKSNGGECTLAAFIVWLQYDNDQIENLKEKYEGHCLKDSGFMQYTIWGDAAFTMLAVMNVYQRPVEIYTGYNITCKNPDPTTINFYQEIKDFHFDAIEFSKEQEKVSPIQSKKKSEKIEIKEITITRQRDKRLGSFQRQELTNLNISKEVLSNEILKEQIDLFHTETPYFRKVLVLKGSNEKDKKSKEDFKNTFMLNSSLLKKISKIQSVKLLFTEKVNDGITYLFKGKKKLEIEGSEKFWKPIESIIKEHNSSAEELEKKLLKCKEVFLSACCKYNLFIEEISWYISEGNCVKIQKSLKQYSGELSYLTARDFNKAGYMTEYIGSDLYMTQMACVQMGMDLMIFNALGGKADRKKIFQTWGNRVNIIRLIFDSDPDQNIGKQTEIPYLDLQLNSFSSIYQIEDKNDSKLSCQLLGMLFGLCLEYNLTICNGNYGIKDLYDRLSSIGQLIDYMLKNVVSTHKSVIDDQLYMSIDNLSIQLTQHRRIFNVTMRQALSLAPPVEPGQRLDWNDETMGSKFLEGLANLDLTNIKNESLFKKFLPNTEIVIDKNKFQENSLKDLKKISELVNLENTIKSTSLKGHVAKPLQEVFTVIQAMQDFPEEFRNIESRGSSQENKKVEGETKEDVDYIVNKMPWDQKAIVSNHFGGRLTKTQEKVQRSEGGPIVGVLLDATFATTSQYERVWKRLYDSFSKGNVYLFQKIKDKKSLTLREVVVQPILNSLPCLSIESTSQQAKFVAHRNQLNQLSYEQLTKDLMEVVSEIIEGKGDSWTLHQDFLRQLPLLTPGICLEYSLPAKYLSDLDKDEKKRSTDMCRFVYMPNQHRLFFTVSHYSKWTLVTRQSQVTKKSKVQTLRTEMPAFFEIINLPVGKEKSVKTQAVDLHYKSLLTFLQKSLKEIFKDVEKHHFSK